MNDFEWRENTIHAHWIDICNPVNSSCQSKYCWECCWDIEHKHASWYYDAIWANNCNKYCRVVTDLEKQKSWAAHKNVIRMRLSNQLNLLKRKVLYWENINESDRIRSVVGLPSRIIRVVLRNLVLHGIYAFYDWTRFCLLTTGFTYLSRDYRESNWMKQCRCDSRCMLVIYG